MYDFLT